MLIKSSGRLMIEAFDHVPWLRIENPYHIVGYHGCLNSNSHPLVVKQQESSIRTTHVYILYYISCRVDAIHHSSKPRYHEPSGLALGT